MAGQWNSKAQRHEFVNAFDDPGYCGYCKCSPCQCDGHGNFGPEENVGWVEVNPLPEFTYEDGTPVPESRERHQRTDARSPERSWRPQRPAR